MKTAIVFGGSRFLKTVILTDSLLRVARRRNDLQILALCDAGESASRSHLTTTIIRALGAILQKAFNPSRRFFLPRERLWHFSSLARRYGVQVIVPPDCNINHPAFIDYLQGELKPDYAFGLGCPQVLKRDLLRLFEAAVNHHNGTLPTYRGWSATEWSIYNGEEESGFTYHYMSEKVDDGPIILAGRAPIAELAPEELDYRKAKTASSQIEEVVDLVLSGYPGRPQVGEAHYYSRKAERELLTVNPSNAIAWAELQRRIRSFGHVRMVLGGRHCRVTSVKRLAGKGSHSRENAFVTADGVSVLATRVQYLPWHLNRLMGSILGS